MKLTAKPQPRKVSALGDLAPLLENSGSQVMCFTKTGNVICIRFFEPGYDTRWNQEVLLIIAPDGEEIDCEFKDDKLHGQDALTCERKDTDDLVWIAEVVGDFGLAASISGWAVNQVQEGAILKMAKNHAISLIVKDEEVAQFIV